MKNFGVTTAVTRLAQNLILEGYSGTITLTNSYPTGAKKVLEDCFSLELTGFCKESLYITADLKDSEIGLVGRYALRGWACNPSVEDVVDQAWCTYLDYKSQGYSRPQEWEKLWIKYGYLTEQKTTVLVEKE